MNPTPDRYAVVLWALREHRRRTKKWQATAAEVAALLPSPGGHTNPVRSVARTLTGMVTAGFVWSSHVTAKETRAWRLENEPHRSPFGAEAALHRPALYSTTGRGDMVNDMLDLVGERGTVEAVSS